MSNISSDMSPVRQCIFFVANQMIMITSSHLEMHLEEHDPAGSKSTQKLCTKVRLGVQGLKVQIESPCPETGRPHFQIPRLRTTQSKSAMSLHVALSLVQQLQQDLQILSPEDQIFSQEDLILSQHVMLLPPKAPSLLKLMMERQAYKLEPNL